MELWSSLVVSMIGLGFASYGKKQHRPPQLIIGLLLAAYPYLVSGHLALWLGAAVFIGVIWIATKLGL